MITRWESFCLTPGGGVAGQGRMVNPSCAKCPSLGPISEFGSPALLMRTVIGVLDLIGFASEMTRRAGRAPMSP